ncbi:Fanconi anemia complex subunit FancL WD-repeat containing domain [Arabidopsis thaliana x Arabidopsis arenosa]|uniref:Fanconi anemia complex subunit FancL WD-repeat containing domain n=2 Tax=Arabidopsis thaliana x Arabidopsis arenosa TaxID=1240361 RepID=A0A8T1XP52_9BRAS|nr:Fanconi anemia complex subunit FancL WD-repeat containing domain [Arabidopsis thaliana x Arabidopsis arenosa]
MMMKGSGECIGRERCEELAKSSSFYRKVYSEIEEIGWEPLRRLGGDLTYFSFQIFDKKGRAHNLEFQLNRDYPNSPPSVSADVPYMFTLEWSTSSRLKDVMFQFQKHLDYLQEFWSVLDDIDKSLCIVDAKQSSRASAIRRIHAGNDCIVIVHIDFKDPKSLPECRFIGPVPPATHMNSLHMLWRRNSNKWSKERSFPENLECILGTELPKPLGLQEEDNQQQVECGICYAQFLPTDEELGARSGTRTDYTCENISCNKSFHSLCLTDWLRSITTTRQSFDVLFGNCPYCSDPVAVKINNK